ncbi:MAG: hypothetical protein LAO24_18925 [Acidobacteriia bacterium]|nr:hypothetical protein [Terriglobia bacterium]
MATGNHVSYCQSQPPKVVDFAGNGSVVVTGDFQRQSADLRLRFYIGRHIGGQSDQLRARGELKGMLSLRNLLEHRVAELARELHSLDQYLSNDGPGG